MHCGTEKEWIYTCSTIGLMKCSREPLYVNASVCPSVLNWIIILNKIHAVLLWSSEETHALIHLFLLPFIFLSSSQVVQDILDSSKKDTCEEWGDQFVECILPKSFFSIQFHAPGVCNSLCLFLFSFSSSFLWNVFWIFNSEFGMRQIVKTAVVYRRCWVWLHIKEVTSWRM